MTDLPVVPADRLPIIYLPGVERGQFRAGEDCPEAFILTVVAVPAAANDSVDFRFERTVLLFAAESTRSSEMAHRCEPPLLR